MTNREQLLSEIAQAPDDLIEELAVFLSAAKARRAVKPISDKRRTPSAVIAGKGETLGDLVSPIVDEQDWECLK
ncbi:hypothetical protein [Leptolyngbya sp. FACHB-17]|uniref:hypothetical protein n=1 Tax=unclassified Leptolyngbya TaxID=2650499 RepID=UPI0016817612|nr:hypothetical protein [Leptolyngbya sp. FACHB-17]MBD2079798.1 hypothetical protein [Leptolyngbya sp. FACHB-17]